MYYTKCVLHGCHAILCCTELCIQGQIAGLRERLKEREADVRELKMLTGGRGQSRLR